MRGFGHALTVVCPQCLSVLDASTPRAQNSSADPGSTAPHSYDPAGHARQARRRAMGSRSDSRPAAVQEDDEALSMGRILLFNPYKGFRYLTEYEGHWNFVTPLEAMPRRIAMRGRPAVSLDGDFQTFFRRGGGHARSCSANFPGASKSARQVIADDFVYPPSCCRRKRRERRSHLVARRIHARRGNLESVRASRQARRRRAEFISTSPRRMRQSRRHVGHFLLMLLLLIGARDLLRDFQPEERGFRSIPIIFER